MYYRLCFRHVKVMLTGFTHHTFIEQGIKPKKLTWKASALLNWSLNVVLRPVINSTCELNLTILGSVSHSHPLKIYILALRKCMAFRLSQIVDGIVAYITVAMATISHLFFQFKTYWPSGTPSLHQ